MRSTSESTPPRKWRFYVEEARVFCDKVPVFAKRPDRVSFAADPTRWDAMLRSIELMGEAATHVPAGVHA